MSAPIATAVPARTIAPRALLVALGTGALGDLVVRVLPQGVDLVVLVAVVVAALFGVARRVGVVPSRDAYALAGVVLLSALATLVRDAAPLLVVDGLAVLAALTALVATLRDRDAPAATDGGASAPLVVAAGAIVTAARVAAGGPQLVARALDARAHPRTALRAGAGTLVRGGALAAPVLLVFALLLLSADPAFARLLEPLARFDIAVEHLVVTGILAWGTAGTLHAALLDRPVAAATAPHDGLLGPLGRALRARLDMLRLGVREVTVALVLVDLLLLAFVLLQLRWLAGGEAALQAAGGTVAEYARRGFGELVALAVLALPVLVVAHAIAGDAATTRGFRAAAGLLLALLLLLALSAGDRMRLYLDRFGLTEARVYASATLVWLAVVFGWAGATLLRGRGRRFTVGALVGAWVTLLALHVVNPEARIAAVNLARAEAGAPLDTAYLGRLGPDAAPVLAARVPALAASHPEPAVRCALRHVLHAAATRADAPGRQRGWRGWRWPVARAQRVLPASARATPPACPTS